MERETGPEIERSQFELLEAIVAHDKVIETKEGELNPERMHNARTERSRLARQLAEMTGWNSNRVEEEIEKHKEAAK